MDENVVKSENNEKTEGKYKKHGESYGRFTGKIEILPKLGGKTYKIIQRAKELLTNKDEYYTNILIVVDTEADKRLMQAEAQFDSDRINILALTDVSSKEIDITFKIMLLIFGDGNTPLTDSSPKILLDISNRNAIRHIMTRLRLLKYIDLVCIPLEEIL